VSYQREIQVVVTTRIARRIHQLDGEIDALGGRVGAIGGHDVPLAQNGDATLDKQARALVVVGDHALANDDPLSALELDFESPVLWSSHIAGLRTIIVVPGVNARLTTVFTREPLKLKRRGLRPAVGLRGRAAYQRKRLRTFLSAWEAIDKAVEDSCCRVCNDS